MDVILGVVLGYITTTMCESFFHRHIQHAPKKIRRIHKQLGLIGSSLHRAWYAHHVVHHYLTFRSEHTRQFQSETEKLRLTKHFSDHGMKGIIETEYGVRIGSRFIHYLRYVFPTLPIFALVCLLGGSYFTLGALVPFIVWPMLAQLIHPYLHMKYKDLDEQIPIYVRLFSKTRYFRFLAIHHWIHHRYEQCNFNLLLGGDIILGVQRYPSQSDWAEIKDAGLWVPN